MKSLRVNYDPSADAVGRIDDAAPEPWQEVCDRFDNDVSRIRDADDQATYTALYACFDDDNRPVYYLVEEDETLVRLRQKTFLSKLGNPEL